MPTRRSLLAVRAVLPFAALIGAAGGHAPPIHVIGGVALGGYDPVAYSSQGAALPGRRHHGVIGNGAEWRFADATNLAAFETDPHRFAPQYGGHCAYAASHGCAARSDPRAWHIHDGKLYLSHNLRALRLWARDISRNIARGDENWPALLHG